MPPIPFARPLVTGANVADAIAALPQSKQGRPGGSFDLNSPGTTVFAYRDRSGSALEKRKCMHRTILQTKEAVLKQDLMEMRRAIDDCTLGTTVDDAPKKNKCYAYFMVFGSFHPARITERVGINPTESCLEGEPVKGTKVVRKSSRWILSSRLDTTATLEQHVADVLTQLDAKKDKFRQLSAELGGIMELVGYFYADYPGLTFERDVIARLSEYSLSVDCDFYYLAGEE